MLENVSKIIYLGIIFDHSLKWNEHIIYYIIYYVVLLEFVFTNFKILK